MRFFNLFLFSLLAVISLSAPNAVAENNTEETATEGASLARCRKICIPRRCWNFFGRRHCFGGCRTVCPPRRPRCLQYKNVCHGGGRRCHGWGPWRRCISLPRRCNKVCVRWGAATTNTNQEEEETAGLENEAAVDPLAAETPAEGAVLANGCRRVCIPRRCFNLFGRRRCFGGCHPICPPRRRRCLQYKNVCVGGQRRCYGWGPWRRCHTMPRHCRKVCIRWGAAATTANTGAQQEEEEANQTEETQQTEEEEQQTVGLEDEAADPVAAETPAEGAVLANGCRRVCMPRRCWTFFGRRTCYGGRCHNICPPKPRRCLQYRNVCNGGGRKCIGGQRSCHGWGPWRRCVTIPRRCFNLPRKCNRVCIRWGAAVTAEEGTAGVENEEFEAADPVAAETPAEGTVLANGCRRVCMPRRCWNFFGRRQCFGGRCHTICPPRPRPRPRRCLQYRNVCHGGGRKCIGGGRRCHGWGPWRRCITIPRRCFNAPRKCNRVCVRWGAATNTADANQTEEEEEEEEEVQEETTEEAATANANQYVIGGAMISGVGLMGGVATYLYKRRNGVAEEYEALQV